MRTVEPTPTSWRRREWLRWSAAGSLFAFIVAGAVLEYGRDRRPETPEQSGAALVQSGLTGALSGPILRDPGVPVPLQPAPPFFVGPGRDPNATLLSDDLRPSSGLWSVSRRDGSTALSRLAPAGGPPIEIPGVHDALDVATWSKEARLAAFLLDTDDRGGLRVEVRRLPSGDRVRRFPRVDLGRPRSQRSVHVGHWSGSRADIFVLDRALRGGRMQVRVLSGESAFRATVLSVIVRQPTGFDMRGWSVDLQDFTSAGRSDLVFSTRSQRTNSGNVEVHVLSGPTNFSRFLLQVRAGHSARGSDRWQVAVVFRANQPQWLLFDHRTGTAIPHPLISGPSRKG